MSDAVFCIVPTEERAALVVEALKLAGFRSKDISALLSDICDSQDIVYTNDAEAAEDVSAGTSTGTLGKTFSWLTGVGALTIPDLGPFIAAGPIVSLLTGPAIGGGLGGVVGGLIGWGLPEYEAKRYEISLRRGDILLSVHTKNVEEAKQVEEIFKSLGAYDVRRSATIKATAAAGF